MRIRKIVNFLFLLLLSFLSLNLQAQHTTVFETSGGKQTASYEQVINWWQQLDKASGIVKMDRIGETDANLPLHLVLISGDADFNLSSLKKKKRNFIFILNGIHPGEPDGIDASMLLAKDIVLKKRRLPANVVLAIIPIYNIGGALNRSPYFRVDQDGPEIKGFRGNSQNLDLNRDFIKMDSREAKSFAAIFQKIDPDIFIDNHVSNGADYQHVMTLISTQHNRLGGSMASYLEEVFEPALYRKMQQKGYDLVPYVNHFGETPEKGWNQFWDSPRYSSGYAALFNTFAFVPETHMLKPYPQRVDATKKLMESFIEFAGENGKVLKQLREKAFLEMNALDSLPLAWKHDPSAFKPVRYKGYRSGKRTSEVSGLEVLYYDRNQPFDTIVPFYNVYRDTLRVRIPKAYIIPQGWHHVIERLQVNRVQMQRLARDTAFEVEVYHIENYQPSQRAFEGHHYNALVRVGSSKAKIQFRKGDYYIPLQQRAARFLVETLEPQGEDSYFAWNFFDAILGQKEGFSAYVFEQTAAAWLKQHPELRKQLEEKKAADPAFAKNARAQLDFIFKNSPYYEPAHMRYPVFRLP